MRHARRVCPQLRFYAYATILASALVLLLVSPSWGQTDLTAGILPFSTQASGTYDSVDLATGSVTVMIPVRSKIGKIPFSFKLVDNSHAYVSSNKWYVPTQFTGHSFSGDFSATLSDQYTYIQECGGLEHIYSSFGITDATGAYHSVPGAGASWGQCGTLTTSGTTSDGSGYNLVITAANPLTYTVYDSSGNALTSSTSNNITTTTMTDPDGATLSRTASSTSTTYVDSLGETVLTFTPGNPYGNPDKYTYTDVNAQVQTVQINYSLLKLKTNFGCTGIADVDWTGLTIYYPTSIVLATGETFGITYESTPGYSGDITGRIASISYPGGGSTRACSHYVNNN